MQGWDFSGPFSNGLGPAAPGGPVTTTTGTPAAGMSTHGGPPNVPFGTARPPHGPVTQGGGLGRDTIMVGGTVPAHRDAFWSGPGQGPSSLPQKSAADMRSATAPVSGGTSGFLPDAAAQFTTTPALADFSSSSAGPADRMPEPSMSALTARAGKAPAGDQRHSLFPSTLGSPSDSSEDWVILPPRPFVEQEDMIGWHATSHHGCSIQAKHRHDLDGGIHFGGMRDVRHAMASHLCAKLEEVLRAEEEEQGGEKEERQAQQQAQEREAAAPEPSVTGDEGGDEDTAMEQDDLDG
ncbi:hypothetical protein PG997_009449 [Apiospora hydei]|uniref:Uncharacterized protein n=1 Tax=Apiospora hydei TaxID=1337664 RepID=A0ABR1VU59_9PEZI